MNKQVISTDKAARTGAPLSQAIKLGNLVFCSGASPRDPRQGNKVVAGGFREQATQALENLKRFCEEHMPGRYEIEVVDLLENPRRAKDDQIVAIPTLVRKLPEPLRKIIGNLSDTERMLVGFDLKPR